jgi:hypothetical protein
VCDSSYRSAQDSSKSTCGSMNAISSGGSDVMRKSCVGAARDLKKLWQTDLRPKIEA